MGVPTQLSGKELGLGWALCTVQLRMVGAGEDMPVLGWGLSQGTPGVPPTSQSPVPPCPGTQQAFGDDVTKQLDFP